MPLSMGTCSWKYPSWTGIVYQPSDKDNWLAAYARHYDTVEVDQWFWSLFKPGQLQLPSPFDAEQYAASVPDDFRFTVKAPNAVTLTHYYKQYTGGRLMANPHFLSSEFMHQFLAALSPLHEKLGPVVFQFEYLNQQKMSGLPALLDALHPFLESLPRDFRYGIELRNPHWIKKPLFDFFKAADVAPVLIEGYYMPPLAGQLTQFAEHIDDTVVLRLMGRDRSGIEKATGKKWHQIVQPEDAVLNALTAQLQQMMHRKLNIYLNVNNHFEGSAPLTISRIRERLDGSDAGAD